MRVILIRHAHTPGNGTHYIGREDLSLDDLGREQARELAARLAAEPIDRIYASPLRRALETAGALANQLRLPIVERDALMEIDFGALSGKPKGSAPLSLRRNHLERPICGGESLADVWRRLEPFAAELAADVRAGLLPAVVGHYWSNRVLFDMLQGFSIATALKQTGYKPANASAVSVTVGAAGLDDERRGAHNPH